MFIASSPGPDRGANWESIVVFLIKSTCRLGSCIVPSSWTGRRPDFVPNARCMRKSSIYFSRVRMHGYQVESLDLSDAGCNFTPE